MQSTLADGLLHNALRDADGVWLPPYLRNDQRYSLGLSVYVQIPVGDAAG